MDVKSYVENNGDRFISELFDWLRIPSVSSDPERSADMQLSAEYARKSLLEAGADQAEVMSTEGHPVVVASKIIDPEKPTVMVYGHYDVQPADPLELWESKPFEPEIRNDKIYARGADDDKGQAFMHVKAFEFLVKNNLLGVNVKFILEGEEEIGSPSLKAFMEKNKELLACDVVLVSDTTMFGLDKPSLTVGLRGLSYFQVEVTGPNRDLHSGLYGGAVANPVNILSEMIARLTDDKNRITIPGFYDDVIEYSQEDRALMLEAPFDLEKYKQDLDIEDVFGEAGYATLERTGIRPSLDVCGIWGGFTGEGAKTVLPSKAYAKISTRLVPNQDYRKIDKLFEDYFKSLAPVGVKVKVDALHGGQGYTMPVEHKGYQAAEKAINQALGKKPVPVRSGGSIPVISDIEQVLGVKSMLMGFGLESDAIHSPNENYPLANFFKGIETIPYFYKYFEELNK